VNERSPALTVGLVGLGSIGQTIALALDRGQVSGMTLAAVTEQNRPIAETFLAELTHPTPLISLDELVEGCDLLVEAAGQNALAEIIPRVLRARKDVLILSVGGLLAHEEWFREAEQAGCRIYVPSGAIGGLDAVKAAARGRLDSVVLTSRKPVAALRSSKYVQELGLNLDELTEDRTIFEGSAEEACRAFPTTSNVAASLRLAAGTVATVSIRIVAAPRGSRNVHEIEASGDFGVFRFYTENFPSEANPRTSRLAALSALATLEGITQSLRVGT
jgi:aspartate dehydrogenase